MTRDRRCPDCGVRMRRTKPVTSLHGDTLGLRTGESRSGVLGRLGFEREVRPFAYVCPDCGLVRFYVDPDADRGWNRNRDRDRDRNRNRDPDGDDGEAGTEGDDGEGSETG